MSAIEASFVRLRSMADGSLQVTVEIEPRYAVAAFALFASPGMPMALAALKCATSKAEPAPEPEPEPKGGRLSQWVAMRCQEPAFHRWLQEAFPAQWAAAIGETPVAWAASTVRAVLGVESRAELDNDTEAAKRFHALIRWPFAGASNVKLSGCEAVRSNVG